MKKRVWVGAGLLIVALLLAGGQQLWMVQRMSEGDFDAARSLWFGRRGRILAVLQGVESPRARAAAVEMLTRESFSWTAEEEGAVLAALNDDAPVVRVAAREGVLLTGESLSVEDGLQLLASALDDDAPIAAAEIDYFLPHGLDWAHKAMDYTQADPQATFSSAHFVTWWICSLEDDDQAAAPTRAGADGSVEAPQGFKLDPKQAAAQRARARELLAAYRLVLAERGDASAGTRASLRHRMMLLSSR